MPAIGLTSLPVAKRWLAITCDPELEWAASTASSTSTGPLSEFVAAWGVADEAEPQFVWDAAKLDANWYLAVRPRTKLSTSSDRLSLLADKDRLCVAYQSDVSPQGVDRFGWSLATPAELAVQRVSVISKGKQIPLEWVQGAPDRLNIFFLEAVSEPYRLELVGSMPMTEDRRLLFPRIMAAGRPPVAQTAALYRAGDVLASWGFPRRASWVESRAGDIPPFDQKSHFVRCYSVDPLTADAVRILVEPNEPVVRGETLTTLSKENRVWTASFGCELRVERGELDVLRLQVPPTFTGPFAVAPPATTEFTPSGNAQQAATLSIRLPQPARPGDTVKFEVRSPLVLADGQLPTAPQIIPLVPGTRQDYLVTAGVTRRRTGRMDPRRDRAGRAAARLAAEVVRCGWCRDVPRRGGSDERDAPAARDAHVRGQRPTCGNDGSSWSARWAGLSSRDLSSRPKDSTNAWSSCRPVSGWFAPRWTATQHSCVRSSRGVGRCSLVRPTCRKFSKSCRGPSIGGEASSRLVELSRPVLEQAGQPIPVELGLWTLCRAAPWGSPRVTGGAVVTPAELATMRLERLASVSQSATRSVIELPVVDGFNWFAHWTAEIRAAERAAKSLVQSSTDAAVAIRVPQPSDDLLSDNIARCDAWIEQVAEIFAATEMTLSGPEPPVPVAFDPWQDATSGPGDSVCFISDGGQNRLFVELVPDSWTAGDDARLWHSPRLPLWRWRPSGLSARRRRSSSPSAGRKRSASLAGLPLGPGCGRASSACMVAAVSLTLLVRRIYLERKSPRHDSSKQSSSIPEELA